MSTWSISSRSVLILVVAVLGFGPVASGEARWRFERQADRVQAGVRWMAVGPGRLVLGGGTRIEVLPSITGERAPRTTDLGLSIVDGVLARDDLYLVAADDEAQALVRLQLTGDLAEAASPQRLPWSSAASLRLARMDDYLVVAHGDRGLSILELPSPHRHGPGHAMQEPREVAFLPLEGPISAIAASRRLLYVARPGEITVVDATTPTMPGLLRRVPTIEPIAALAANGPTVLAVGSSGLRILDMSVSDRDPTVHRDPTIVGSSVAFSGRSLLVANDDDGLVTFRDVSAIAATFDVDVGDLFFSPAGTIDVNVGDQVRWLKFPTTFLHNVRSCTALQSGCNGIAANESFTSGAATTDAFIFSHTFIQVGANPYVCQVHPLTMQGNVMVAGTVATPPPVPDGSGATSPMTVEKTVADGSGLTIQFDASCAGAAQYDLIHGTSAQLPTTPGGVYGLSGATCAIGTTSPFAWATSPFPVSGDFLWWLLVADDGSNTEGSWGVDGSGSERNGSGTGGASGLCGNTAKDPTANCAP